MRLSYIALFFIILVACSPASSFDLSVVKSKVRSTAVKALTKAGFKFGGSNDVNPHSAGLKCWICTMLVGAAEKYAEIKNMAIDTFLVNEFCPLFPSEAVPLCQELIEQFGPTIITTLLQSKSPDQVCRAIGICSDAKCNLFKNTTPQVTVSSEWAKNIQMASRQGFSITPKAADHFYSVGSWFSNIGHKVGGIFGSAQAGGKDLIHKLIEKLLTNHTSPFDMDGDGFSQMNGEMRGYNWRGRDCNDFDIKVRPGRKTDPYPGKASDYNCNGIHGVDPKTKKPYKEVLCGNTKQYGVVVLGDSAGALADIPQSWPNASMWANNTFKGIIDSVLNEVDLPHMSGYTGYADENNLGGPVRSVYKHLYERNKCNFRDYQNVAVNGASSLSAMDNIKRLTRDQQNDHPLLMFLELVGNDVCSYLQNFDNMTKPDAFKKSIIQILDHLDTVAPAGSHLVILGLVNGSLIFEGVKGHTHPTGVSYEDFYDFTSCIQASFCWGWLNTDKSVRDKTTSLAMELNQVYAEILKTYKAKNYDIIYYDFPAQTIFDQVRAEGKDPYILLNPVDGFHPNPNFHSRLGDYLWNSLLRDRPDWFGDVNPNNDLITKLFGNQGGY